jgi:hypothetical protein
MRYKTKKNIVPLAENFNDKNSKYGRVPVLVQEKKMDYNRKTNRIP